MFINTLGLKNKMEDKYPNKSLGSHIDEIGKSLNEDNIVGLSGETQNNYDKENKEKRDKDLDYKILKTKASSHVGAHVIGPIMEWYYKKFKDYSPGK